MEIIMKILAFYLPQFHVIPENNKWWGENFTEWVTVKNAKPWFKGHSQPEEPYENNYYNLLDEKVQEQQAKLALEYGIDGFCYYHYWFEGKLLLEKPMKNMLLNQNIAIPYCVCWANESWARTWDGREKNILIKQNYKENRDAWKRHYEYLSKFFFDDRYIKENNKPVLIVYKPQLIDNIAEMMGFWNELALEDGFNGIEWGYQHPSAFYSPKIVSEFDFGIEFEPLYTDSELEGERINLEGVNRIIYGLYHPTWLVSKIKKKLFRLPSIRNYDEVWNKIITRTPKNKSIMPGAFPSWDNTPRKGNNGIVFYEASPEKFKRYLALQMQHANTVYNAKYLFINAWNEWGEGAHLEPDKVNKFGYLQGVRNAKELLEKNEFEKDNSDT